MQKNIKIMWNIKSVELHVPLPSNFSPAHPSFSSSDKPPSILYLTYL